MDRKYTIFINHPSHGLTDYEPWGDGLIAWQFIDQLARRGHQLYITAPVAKLRGPLHPNVHLTLVKTWNKYQVSYPSWPHRIEYAIRVRRLFKKLQASVKFDLIHQLNPVTSGVNLFLPTNGIPWFVGLVWPQWPSATPKSRPRLAAAGLAMTRNLLRWELFRRASCILVAVPGSRAVLPESPEIQSRVRLLHCGIDTNRFAPAPYSLGEAAFDPNVLFLATLNRNKGIYVLLEAFETVVKNVPEARLTIAGDGPERERVKEMVLHSPAASRIAMVGSLGRDKVADAFRSCAVYCLPSFGEPFGQSALEAMSCGKAVVVTAAGGLDYLVDELGGAKVPVGDAEKLAEALIGLLKNPQLCQQMGDHNRQVALSRYDWNAVAAKLEQIYEETIAGSFPFAAAG